MLLYPQQYASPVVVTPHVWSKPALTDAQLFPPLTSTGVVLFPRVVPSPSRPLLLDPQQYASPAVVTPHVWLRSALTDAQLCPPLTLLGAKRCIVVPSPSRPLLLYPQQYASPVVVTPHVWSRPALTNATPVIVADALAMADPDVALIVTAPLLTEVTRPVSDTVAIAVFDDDHVTVGFEITAPPVSLTVAESCVVSPSKVKVSTVSDSAMLAAT